MSGSAAEERIRAKAEAALREVYPDARIIHELMLRQGGCRIDLAAVTESRLITVEIKSERDVLARLKEQARQAREVSDGFYVVLAEPHWRKAWEDDHVSILEAVKEDEIVADLRRGQRGVMTAWCNAPARLAMLWADELRWIAGQKGARHFCITAASDAQTGSQIRRAVCAALRARPFPRADPAIPVHVLEQAA